MKLYKFITSTSAIKCTIVAAHAEISQKVFNDILLLMLSKSHLVEKMTDSSFLNEKIKRNYWQSYQGKLKQLIEI